MLLKLWTFILSVLLLTSFSPPILAQPDLAHVMVEKSISKIISPSARRNIRIDIETITEDYNTNGNLKQPAKPRHKTTDGRLEVQGMNIEELYQALGTIYDFYIDPNESTAVINSITCAVVKFQPKPNLPVNKTADNFINRSEGSIYINLDSLVITRLVGSIKNPFYFTFYWKSIPITRIDVYQFKFEVEYIQFGSVVVEKTLNGLADYEIRNRGTKKFTNNITNHRTR